MDLRLGVERKDKKKPVKRRAGLKERDSCREDVFGKKIAIKSGEVTGPCASSQMIVNRGTFQFNYFVGQFFGFLDPHYIPTRAFYAGL
jgi:hypothetical protein